MAKANEHALGAYRTADDRWAAWDKLGQTWLVSMDEASEINEARRARLERR